MSTAREKILGRVRAATSALPSPTPHPEYDTDLPVSHSGYKAREATDLVAAFAGQWSGVSGRYAADWAAVAELLKVDDPTLGYCAPQFAEALLAVWPEAPIETTFERARVDEYAFGITPAWGAIAETGTILLTDTLSPARLAALAPWTHVAVAPRAHLYATVGDALAAVPRDPSIVMVTGPSKTADIEGILIEGVHGPGIQVALITD